MSRRLIHSVPVPEQVRLVREHNIQSSIQARRAFLRDLQTAPIYLAATHGHYDIDIPLTFFEVPENTHILELTEVSDSISVAADTKLWELLQKRDLFRDCLFNNTISQPPEELALLKGITSAMRYYKPGDTVCQRILTLGEPERDDKRTWGYFKFLPEVPYGSINNSQHHPFIFTNYLDDTLLSIREKHYSIFFNRNNTNLNFIRKMRSVLGYSIPLIFVFNSCGATHFSMKDVIRERQRLYQIMKIQEDSRLSAKQMGMDTGAFVEMNSMPVQRSRVGISGPISTSRISSEEQLRRFKQPYTEEESFAPGAGSTSGPGLRTQTGLYTLEQMRPHTSLHMGVRPLPITNIKQVYDPSCLGGICRTFGLYGGSRRIRRKSKRSKRSKKTRRTL